MKGKRKGLGVTLTEVLLWPLRRMPLGFHYFWGRVIAWLLERVFRYRYEVVLVNLSRSFPEKKYREICDIAHAFYLHIGELIAEAVWFGGCRGERGRARLKKSRLVEVVNPEALNEAFSRGNGAMLLMSHRGNWELFGGFPFYAFQEPFLATYDKMAVVYKQFSSRFGDRFIEDNRCAPLQDLPGFTGYVEAKEIMRYAISHRRENFTYMFNTDQYPYKGSLRYDVGEFLHQPTLAMGGAASLATKLGMSIFYLHWERPRRGKWTIRLDLIAQDGASKTPEEVMKNYYQRLQADLEEDPARYLWSHKRWK